jgi:hypothetical protein
MNEGELGCVQHQETALFVQRGFVQNHCCENPALEASLLDHCWCSALLCCALDFRFHVTPQLTRSESGSRTVPSVAGATVRADLFQAFSRQAPQARS